MTAHAFLAPSSAHRWVRCGLSARLEAAYPESEASPSSLEGTAAHWVVQECLYRRAPAVGTQAPNGIAVDAEMLEAAELVVDDIIATLGPNWPQMLVVEQRVQIPRVHPQNWGTPDYRAWAQMGDRRALFVWDFKYGHGVVEAFENWQLIDYVAGCLSEAGVTGADDQRVWVNMRVIQPRAYHRDGPVRHWAVAASDLRGYVNRLAMAAEDATSITPTATPTEDCENCKGRHACEALQRDAYRAADRGKQFGALDLPIPAKGLELRTLKRAQALLDARVTGLEAEIVADIKRGASVPFWAMESKPGRLAWSKPAAEVLALGQMLGLPIAADPSPITPTQAKKAGFPEALLNAYASRPVGSAQLVADDGRKARLTFSSSVA